MSKTVNPEEVKLDHELENGPIDNRKCTDILFFLLFVASTIALIVMIIYGIVNGNPNTLMAPYDPDANGCGIGKAE